MGAWGKTGLACLGLATIACGQRGDAASSSRHAVIVGGDDRTESYAVADDALRELAQHTAMAIFQPDSLAERSGEVSVVAPTLQESTSLCPGTRFAEQPAAALCSGLLVAPDLVLTAGHCISFVPCSEMRLVRRYLYDAEGELAPLTTADVFRCAEVVAREHSVPTAAERLDFAWVRLDRKVPGFVGGNVAVRGAAEPLQEGEPLVMFGFPAGVPLKVDEGARVMDPRPEVGDYFVASTDSFYGSSGSPIFDGEGRLAGIQNRGAVDYTPTDEGCNVLAEVGEEPAAVSEQATYAFRATDALCALEAPPPLCGNAAQSGGESGCGVARRGARVPSLHALLAGLLAFFGRRRVRDRTPPDR